VFIIASKIFNKIHIPKLYKLKLSCKTFTAQNETGCDDDFSLKNYKGIVNTLA
jgi:hypothetical protein